MDRTDAMLRPCWPFSTENCTLTANIAAFKKRLLTVDRGDDVEHADRAGLTSEPKASSCPLGSDDQVGLLQLREQFCYIFGRYTLQLGKSPNARWTSLVERLDEIEQAVQSILHPRSDMRHYCLLLDLRISSA